MKKSQDMSHEPRSGRDSSRKKVAGMPRTAAAESGVRNLPQPHSPYVNVHNAKTNLSKLLERAESGEEIVIARAGKPVAKLVSYKIPRKPRVPGGLEGAVWVAEDFDDYIPDEIARAFGGEET